MKTLVRRRPAIVWSYRALPTPPLPPLAAEKVLQRGEKIELLVDKTELLSSSARKFQKQSKALKNVMWCKNVKMWLLIAFVLVIIAWLISSFVCGFNYQSCPGSSK